MSRHAVDRIGDRWPHLDALVAWDMLCDAICLNLAYHDGRTVYGHDVLEVWLPSGDVLFPILSMPSKRSGATTIVTVLTEGMNYISAKGPVVLVVSDMPPPGDVFYLVPRQIDLMGRQGVSDRIIVRRMSAHLAPMAFSDPAVFAMLHMTLTTACSRNGRLSTYRDQGSPPVAGKMTQKRGGRSN